MKLALSLLALLFTLGTASSAFAFDYDHQLNDLTAPSSLASSSDDDDDEEDYNYRVCAARDSGGREYRYYTTVHHFASYTQRRAVEKCRANSPSPRSCRATGCREY